MLKQRRAAIQNVSNAFLPAERSMEQAAMQMASCIAVMIEQRKAANLPIDTGADQLEMLAEASYLATQAHVRVAKAHAAIRNLPRELGVTNYGADPACEPNNPFVGADLSPPLRFVA